MNSYYWKLEDGRIWSTKDASFITEVPNGIEVYPSPVDEDQEHSIEGLIQALEFYNLPKGELKTDEEKIQEIRAERNKRIAETDYLVMPDYPISPESEKDIRKYRQDLRDITMQGGFPNEVNWPKMPEIH